MDLDVINPSAFQIGQRETEEVNYQILVRYSSICKLGIGKDVFRQPCKCSRYLHPFIINDGLNR
jgi:hypothetical protein